MVKVLDFGLAKALEDGTVASDPEFAAPEQSVSIAQGQSGAVEARL
jgi:hypothetical protein